MIRIISTHVHVKACKDFSDNWQLVSTVTLTYLFTISVVQKSIVFCMRAHSVTGIEGFSAIESIDPMKLNRIKIFQGEGPVSINSSLSKATVTGFANTEVLSNKLASFITLGTLHFVHNQLVILFFCFFPSSLYQFFRVNPVDYSWETHLMVPKIRIDGNYHMQGRILVIPLNGHGKCWFEPSKTVFLTIQNKFDLEMV